MKNKVTSYNAVQSFRIFHGTFLTCTFSITKIYFGFKIGETSILERNLNSNLYSNTFSAFNKNIIYIIDKIIKIIVAL